MNIIDLLSDRPIVYHPQLASLCGSINAAVFLHQLLYWWARKTKDTVYKTIADFEEELCMTRDEQDGAIKKLKSLGFISIELKGIPATRHFTVNEEVLSEKINLQTSLWKTHKLVCGKPANLIVENPQTNTESTAEMTTEIKNIKKNSEYSTSFERWWNAYPARNGSKNGKQPAWKKWQTLRDLPPIEELLKILEIHKQSKKWKDGFPPDPPKWLNQKCWLDEVNAHIPTKEERDDFLIKEYYKLRFDKFADKYGYDEGHRIDGLVEDIELSKSPRRYD